MLPVEQPFKTYTGLDGKPLNNGYVYIGQVGQDPIAHPVTVFWDAAGTLPAAQPLRTVNGYIVNDASAPANVFYNAAFSELVQDSKLRQVFYAPTSTDFSIATYVQGFSGADGASLIGYGADTVKGALDALQLVDYTALRSYNGKQPMIFIVGSISMAGVFIRDDADTATADDGGICIVTAGGKRYKRVFDGLFVDPEWWGADPTGVADSYTAGQKACNWASSNGRLTVRWGAGSFKLSASIKTTDVTATPGTVACGFIGAGEFSTKFLPTGDFSAINFVSSYLECGCFSVEWPATAKASISAARYGVELADGNTQVAYATVHNITVSYGYRAVALRDWTGSTYGTVYELTLHKVTAFRCADYGFWLSSKTGSTTVRMIQCYSRGDDMSGVVAGKGFYAININDIYTEVLSVDQCLDNWVTFINYNQCVMVATALESNKIVTASAVGILLQGSHSKMSGIKDLSTTCDTGGSARIIFAGAQCQLTIEGYDEQFPTVAAGTTKYRAALNASGTDISILDRSILPSQVLDNGWYCNFVYQGVRRSSTGSAPNYGTWVRGDYVKNGVPSIGQPKGQHCTATGSPGTWQSEGNL